MKSILSIMTVFIIWSSTLLAHPVHVSVCNLEFEKDSIKISVKLFRDDLANAIEFETGIKTDLGQLDSSEKQKIVCSYIFSQMKFFLNGKSELKMEYDGNEMKEDAVWMNFHAPLQDGVKSLKIQNTLLVDSFPDQTNLLIINYKGKQMGYRFNHDQRIIEPTLVL